MGDHLMGFPTPKEVFGETKYAKNKSRKPPPSTTGLGPTAAHNGSQQQYMPQYAQQPIIQQQQQQHYQQQAPIPQQQQQYQQRSGSGSLPIQQYYSAPAPVIPAQQQFRSPQIQQQQYQHVATRQSSQPSLHSSYSSHSSPSSHSLPYNRSSAPQQVVLPPQQQQQQQQVPAGPGPGLGPRSKKEVFDSLDRNRSGSLSFQELALGLQNRDGSKFALQATSSIFKLFDSDDSQSLSYAEFCRLFDCLDRWKSCFLLADKSCTNSLSFSEFQDALQVLGYRLSTDTALYVFQTFSRANLDMKFDMFIESCVYLIGVTRVFKKFDPQGNGVALIQFENFVEEVLKLKTRH